MKYGMRERNHQQHVCSSNGEEMRSSNHSRSSLQIKDKHHLHNYSCCPPGTLGRRWYLLWLRIKPSNVALGQTLLILLAIWQLCFSQTLSKHSTKLSAYSFRLLRGEHVSSRPSRYSGKPIAIQINGSSVQLTSIAVEAAQSHGGNEATAATAAPAAKKHHPSFSDDGDDDNGQHRSECHDMYDWQSQFYPTCNNLHETSFIGIDKDEARLVDNGLHRDVWEVLLLGENDATKKSWALKTLRYSSVFDKWHERGQIKDAIVSERLTNSPYIADIYGFCGFSALYDFASEGTLQDHYPDLSREERLKVAAYAARALRDVHTFGSEGGNTFGNRNRSAICHADIAVRQFVYLNGMYKLNDFNTAGLLKWNTLTDTSCGHKMGKAYDKNRAPEEMYNNTNIVEEMIDVYSLGNIFYKLLCNERKYNHIHTPEAQELIKAGDIPKLCHDLDLSDDLVVVALKRAMHMCLILDPYKRATASEVSEYLDKQLFKMEREKKLQGEAAARELLRKKPNERKRRHKHKEHKK